MSQNTPETIFIRAEPIELSQLLKYAGIFGSGGEAKFAINGGQVTVNGAVELQARKKILGGQTVEIGGRALLVKLGGAVAAKVKKAPKPAAKAGAKPQGKPQSRAAAPAGARPERTEKAAKPYAAAGAAKPAFRATKAAAPVRRDRDEDDYEDETPRAKPAVSAAGQRTFFYTELLKAQQAKRKKR